MENVRREELRSALRRGQYFLRQGLPPLLPLTLTLRDRDVTIDWKIGKAFDRSAGLRPFHFEPVQLRPVAHPQHHARIVRGKIASATYFHPGALQIARLVGDACPNSVDIGLLADELYPQPVILAAKIVAQENRRLIVARDERVDASVIVEVAQG